MTNLDVIKYLANNNPTRLAELISDIYCHAWNAGVYYAQDGKSPFEENDIDDFNEWFNRDAATTGLYYDEELEEWSKVINQQIRNCLNCAHLGNPFIWCDACDDFEYWEAEK